MLTALEEEADESGEAEIDEELDSLRTENKNLKAQLKTLKTELNESTKTIKSQNTQLSSLNIHNAKLVFATKIFRSHNLNESEKVKVVETIDKATTLNEAKLVYQTIDESFKSRADYKKQLPKSAKTLLESMASKPVLTTQPVEKKKILTESDEMIERFKKLANISKK
jgi:tRNA C32,U32 (ribose-2'-O)-methylase TrmJ